MVESQAINWKLKFSSTIRPVIASNGYREPHYIVQLNCQGKRLADKIVVKTDRRPDIEIGLKIAK